MGTTTIAFLHGSTMDWVFLGVLLGIVTLEIFRVGTSRAVAIVLALPVAQYLLTALSHAAFLGMYVDKNQTPLIGLLVFIFFLLGAFILIQRMASSSLYSNSTLSQAFIAGIAATVMLMLIWIQTPQLSAWWEFGPLVQSVFGEQFRFFLTLGSLLLVAFVSA